MNLTQLHYAMALQVAPNIGDIKAKKLIQHCGSPEAVFKSSKKELLAIDGIGTAIVNGVHSSKILKQAEAELEFVQKHNIKALYFEENSYPFSTKTLC